MGLGTAINVVAVLVGGGIAELRAEVAAWREGSRRKDHIIAGLVTVLIGIQNFLKFGKAPTRTVPTLTLVAIR